MKQIKNHTLLSALCDNLDNTIAVTNPADQTLIGHVQAHSREEVEATILRARDAQKAWARTTAKQRAAILMRWYELLMENQEDLARIMTLEQGSRWLNLVVKWRMARLSSNGLQKKVSAHTAKQFQPPWSTVGS